MPSFSELVNQILGEVSPPGWSGTVKAMKKHGEIDNPWALAWYMKGKGYTPHKPEEAIGDEDNPEPRAWTGGTPPPEFKDMPENAKQYAIKAYDEQVMDYKRAAGEWPKADALRIFWNWAVHDAHATYRHQYESEKINEDGGKVIISPGSGVNSGRTGTVVSPREVKTDGRGVPVNVEGAYKPVDWDIEVAVRLDDGELITMYKNRLIRERRVDEVSPKGWKKTVKKMKKHKDEIEEPFALAHWMKKKGYEPSEDVGDNNNDDYDPEEAYEPHQRSDWPERAEWEWMTHRPGEEMEEQTGGLDFDPVKLASEWHGGQRSPLYSFASTGKIWGEDHKDEMMREIEDTLGKVSRPEEIEELKSFQDWLESVTDPQWYAYTPGTREDIGGDYGRGPGHGMGTGTPYVGDVDMKTYKEGARVVHPTKGGNQPGTVTKISESGVTVRWDNLQERLAEPTVLPFKDAKYLNIIEEYSSDEEYYSSNPDDVYEITSVDSGKTERMSHKQAEEEFGREEFEEIKKGYSPNIVAVKVSESEMPKKEKMDESLIAVGMAPIGGTIIMKRPSDDLDLTLTYEDMGLVIENDDDNDEDSDDSDTPDWDRGKTSHEASGRSELRKSSEGGADYTNVPRPADSVLTNQENQPKVKTDPLATMDGAEVAHSEQEPDGDYGTDLVPVDAPDIPDYKQGDYGNARSAGGGESDTVEVSDADSGDYSETKPEDKNKKVEEENMNLTYEDLGLKIINEGEAGQGVSGYAEDKGSALDYDVRETHEPGHGEIAFTRELLDKLLMAVSKQTPEKDELDAICQGLENASSKKGETLDVGDVEMIQDEMKSAYVGEEDEVEEPEAAPEEPDVAPEGGEYDDTEREADEADDDYYDYEEDRAPGDGKVAGPEGGEEHEGKTQLMGNKGGERADYIDQPEEKEAFRKTFSKEKGEGASTQKAFSKAQSVGKKADESDGTSGTPIGTGANKGPGGGSTVDLSKPKNQRPSKPLGSDKGKGPGGGSTDEFGQKPTEEGGSNLLPANPDGTSRATPQGPWADVKELNPRDSKALAAESKKRKKSKKQIDEAIMLGMASIPSTMRGTEPEIQIEDDDPDAELKMMRRRAGIERWWVV